MAFRGSIEDMPAADVVHLLHVSRKTGTLHLTGPDGEATMAFREGAIVYASHPRRSTNIGSVLIEMGAVDPNQVKEALAIQELPDRKPLVATLVDLGHIDLKAGHQGLETLIQRTLVEVVSWEGGEFSFHAGDLEVDDGFCHVPEAMRLAGGVNTEQMLVEAVRVFDERNRDRKRTGADLQRFCQETQRSPVESG